MSDTAARAGAWSPLRIASYRSVWIAHLQSTLGGFMLIVAAAWSMTTLTSSTVLIGLVQTAWAAPGFLLAVYAGALSDLLDRRRVIQVAHLVGIALAVALAFMHGTGGIRPWSLLLGIFLVSVSLTASAPAFLALTPELVDEPRVPQAIGLDGASRHIAQTAGPAIAGLVIARSAPGWVFVLTAVSFAAILVAVRRLRLAPRARGSLGEVHAAIGEGLSRVVGSKRMRLVAANMFAVSLVTSALLALLPVAVSRRLGGGGSGYGLLGAAIGLGAVLGVWAIGPIRARLSANGIMATAGALWSAGLAGFAMVDDLVPAFGLLVVTGLASMLVMNALWSTFVLGLDVDVRGRGVSIAIVINWSGMTVGSVLWGLLASRVGDAVTLGAAASWLALVAVGLRGPLPVR